MTVRELENKYNGITIVLGSELNAYEENGNQFIDDCYYITTDDGIVVNSAFGTVEEIDEWFKENILEA